MDDRTPTPEFEKKVQAAASAPSASPKFVNHLRAQVIAAGARANPQPMQTPLRGNQTMRTRFVLPALVAVIAIAVAAFFAFNPVTTVSAQQILDRATAAQAASASATTSGILHTRILIEQNFQALGGDKPAVKNTVDSYYDGAAGQYRYVTTNAYGKIVEASGKDGAYTYTTKEIGSGTLNIYRTPLTPDDLKKGRPDNSVNMWKSLFDQFNNNPRVSLESKVTWTDGSQAYVLVDHSYQTQKGKNGQTEQTYTGAMKMIFNAQTYALLATETSIRKDGKDIVIDASHWLVDEVLPTSNQVAWDLRDLPDVKIVDEAAPTPQNQQPDQPMFETLSLQQLASRAKDAYILKTIPAGFTLEIPAGTNQPKDQPYAFEVNYTNASNESFDLQCVNDLEPGFVEANFYDGSYVAASGLVLHYSVSRGSHGTSTNAMLTTKNGTNYLLYSTFPREKVQSLVEDLIPLK